MIMPTYISVEEAMTRLPELLASLSAGEELILTMDGQRAARLIKEPSPRTEPRQPGTARGVLTIISEDEEHLEDFKEYMP
jgi:antitoxin (DNA-binding transcriptional repressor) of toxin-antitoxin stability system